MYRKPDHCLSSLDLQALTALSHLTFTYHTTNLSISLEACYLPHVSLDLPDGILPNMFRCLHYFNHASLSSLSLPQTVTNLIDHPCHHLSLCIQSHMMFVDQLKGNLFFCKAVKMKNVGFVSGLIWLTTKQQ